MSNIKFLSYEFRIKELMLFINYELDGREKWTKFSVDAMSTANIEALQGELLAVNPSVEFRTDRWSVDAQRRNAKYVHQVPTTRIGWVKFALKWFCIGAGFELILFLAFVPKHLFVS